MAKSNATDRNENAMERDKTQNATMQVRHKDELRAAIDTGSDRINIKGDLAKEINRFFLYDKMIGFVLGIIMMSPYLLFKDLMELTGLSSTTILILIAIISGTILYSGLTFLKFGMSVKKKYKKGESSIDNKNDNLHGETELVLIRKTKSCKWWC